MGYNCTVCWLWCIAWEVPLRFGEPIRILASFFWLGNFSPAHKRKQFTTSNELGRRGRKRINQPSSHTNAAVLSNRKRFVTKSHRFSTTVQKCTVVRREPICGFRHLLDPPNRGKIPKKRPSAASVVHCTEAFSFSIISNSRPSNDNSSLIDTQWQRNCEADILSASHELYQGPFSLQRSSRDKHHGQTSQVRKTFLFRTRRKRLKSSQLFLSRNYYVE